jgi:hypothetical protein
MDMYYIDPIDYFINEDLTRKKDRDDFDDWADDDNDDDDF